MEQQFNRQQPKYAGFLIRLFAHFIDNFIIYFTLSVLTQGMMPDVIDSSSPEEKLTLESAINQLTLISFLAASVYEIILNCSILQGTPGKFILGIKVVDEEGKRITLTTSVLRYFGKMLSGLIFFIGYLMIIFSDKKRGLHDHLAKTYVVKF